MSSIEWTDETWNPTVGCSRVSAGCERCYAERVAARGMQEAHRGLTAYGSHGVRWTGEVRLLPERLEQPLHWRKPRKIFVDSMSDLFHEKVPDEFIDRVFAVMALCPQHTFQVLTKRPKRMLDYMTYDDGVGRWSFIERRAKRIYRETYGWIFHVGKILIGPLPHVWLGVSIENQATADERIPLLLQTPAAVRFVSAEPLLGPVDLSVALEGTDYELLHPRKPVDWIIVGGESGISARPCNVEWIRSIVQQCRAAGVACFVKQMGSHHARKATRDAGCRTDSKGANPDEWPEDLCVREMPNTG